MLKQNFGWAWSMWTGRPRIDRLVIGDVQYQFDVNLCRNEEVNFQGSYVNSVGGDSGNARCVSPRRMFSGSLPPKWAGPWDRVVIREFQGSNSGRTDGQKDGDQYNIPTLLKAWR
ncbi:hypothetical protein DPMN_069532 [Dreissena polymorpha]|uniref:Uncharacterized protein n=1 Tax=Dreissena polymorpha TaxID=45954 RepID=A0A9D3Z3F9_DREPO|nr:hypothetical protein DPMN_069532 [Dreissena polymorpha]